MKIGKRLALATALLVMASSPALAQDDELDGVIVQSGNGQIVLQVGAERRTVTYDADTRIRASSGPLNARREDRPASDLLPGLPIKIEGTAGAGSFAADSIEFKQDDFRTAEQIRAGQASTREALAQAGEFDLKEEATVYFASGSASISAEGHRALDALAAKAVAIDGYMISVLGYADPSGDAAANQRLSERRADNVINYLKQRNGIQPGRVLSASAMGEVTLSGADDNPANYQSARRVTARVVVSRARLANP
jgi:outer membrane protein OmpA-like peptidoglycan-associated protein